MSVNNQALKVVAAFQRYLKTGEDGEINAFTLAELRSVDEQLGDRDTNSAWRLGIRNRIGDLQQKEQRKHESYIRSWQLVAGIITALLIAGLAKCLYDT